MTPWGSLEGQGLTVTISISFIILCLIPPPLTCHMMGVQGASAPRAAQLGSRGALSAGKPATSCPAGVMRL